MTVDSTSAAAYTVAVHGTLRFNPAVNTRLQVTNLMVMGDHGMAEMTQVGHLEVGTAANPIAIGRTAEIVINNAATGGGVADPEQFGTGIINFGKFTMHGAAMTPTFVRVAAEPRAGNTTFTMSEPVSGWKAGDRLVIPDTRHIKASETTNNWINTQNQWEERTVQSVSADGRTVTLTSGLAFDHLGARSLAGVLDFLPHVGNLTRNAVIRSESASGTRGHVISVHTADTDIRYALFRDLGRTKYTPLNTSSNAIGRYPIHMHHNRGPLPTPANGYQFTLVGNAVDGGSAETQFKWGIAIHNSHYGLIQDNVVYNYNGSSIATEDGSESFNVFDHNFALRGIGEPNNSVSEARNAMGTEGVGFWFRGPNNYVRNNVAANFQNPTTEAAYGFVYQFIRLGNISTPNFKGADPGTSGQFTTRDGNNMPILQFDNNEAYGAMQGGFTYWWVSSQDPQPAANAQESLIKNLKIWHVYNKAVYHYPSQKITFDGLIIRGKYDSSAQCCGQGIYGADYSTKGVIVRNSDIQGMDEGIQFPEAGFGPEPNLTVENSYLRNDSNIQVPTNGSVNGCWMQNKLVVITNTRFEAPPGRTLHNIDMVRDVGYAPECLSKLNEVRVYAYNGVASDNFQIYHSNSSVVPRPPSSCSPTTRSGIGGLLCPIAAQGPVPPTVTLSASPQSVTSGQASVLSWNSSNATTVTINQGIGTVPPSGTRSVTPTATTTYTVTATNSEGSATASATVTVGTTPLPTATLTASPTAISSGAASTLSWSSTNATSVSINQGIGTVAASGTRSVSPTATITYTLTATNSSGSVTATATVTVNTTPSAHTKDRANAYDDAWQSGANGWVDNAKAILAAGTGQVPGMVMWIGDSLTRDPALGAWAQNGAGRTAEDQMIADWMHAGQSPQGIDSIDGFALATPYFCPARSFTVGDGLGSWHFMGASSMPADTNPTTARQKLLDCSTYPNALNLTTMLAGLKKPQFAIPEVNLDSGSPDSFPDLERMVDLMISKGIVPIIITYTYRTDASFNQMVDEYNTALTQYAQSKKLPLIDFNKEMLLRLPFSQWPGRFLSDGVHYTKGTTTYPSTSDPYANGGDSATHGTGIALTYNGYGLKGWLGVQKMKEIKELVIDSTPPPPPPAPTATLSAAPSSITQGQSATLTWNTTDATSVSINQSVGTVAASGTRSVSPSATTTYTLTATNATGTTTATATVTVSAAPPPLPTATLSASPASITAGGASTLTWSTTGATSVTINQGIGTVQPSGTLSVAPASTTTYTLTATNGSGSVTATATVTVTPPPMPTVTLSASPLTIESGQSTTLTWTSTNAASVSISQNVGAVPLSGNRSVSPTANITYTITATNATGTATANVSITVTPPMPTATLTASPATIMIGASATLTWSTTNATSVTINQGIGTVPPSGTRSVTPLLTTTYTLTATNTRGSVTESATVTVTLLPTLPDSPLATIGLTAGWATFGQAVPQGLATDGLAVGDLPTQTDVKNRWPDGSIRFAVVTVSVPATGNYPIAAGAVSSESFTPAPVDASVNLQIGSTAYTATLPAATSSDVWLAGPLVREDRRVVRPVSSSGAPHPFLRVNFDRRVFNDGQSRVDVSVENMLDKAGATTVTYDVVVVVNGETVFTKAAVQHYYLTRWRKLFATGSMPPAEITPDIDPFNETRALPPYLPLVTNVVSAPTGAAYDILKPGALLANMPDQRSRPELAPYPDWTARYLVHKNPTQRAFVLANGDLSGSWPIHVREREGGANSGVGSERYVSLDQRPNIWYDLRAQGAGFDYLRGTPLPMREYQSTTPGPGQSPLIPDNAHQPSLAYVPYLLTGDRYYAEEMAFWANYSMLRTYNGDGVRSSQGLLKYNEVQGFGWALRNIVDAAAYYPDASPMKAYLSEKVSNNLTWLDGYANSQDPTTNPFTVLWVGQRQEGPQYRALWEENYLAYAIDRAFQQGFAGGLAHRDAIAKFQVRLFNSEPAYPRLQAAPNVVGVGTPSAGGFLFQRTMTEIWTATQSQTRPFAGNHGPEARLNLMIGIENGWAGAQDAYEYLWPFLAVQPAFGSVPDLGQRAGWALDFYAGSPRR